MWNFASNYAGASIGLGQTLERSVSAESIKTNLEMFDVIGRSFGTMTLSAIRQCTTYEVSAEIAEAVRLDRSAEKETDDAIGELPQHTH